MRRYRLLLIVTLVWFVGLLWSAWYYRPWDPINRRTFHSLELGMTLEQVEELIGLPPGTYQPQRPRLGGSFTPGYIGFIVEQSGLSDKDLPDRFRGQARDGREVTLAQWWGMYYAIRVAFDSTGVAVGLYLLEVSW
jgi:hypothetical protein